MSVPARPRPVIPPRSPYSGSRHVRAALLLLAFVVVVGAIGFPLAVVEFGQLLEPSSANGSLTHSPNGSVNGSKLLPANTTATAGGFAALPPGPAALPTAAGPAGPAGETVRYPPGVPDPGGATVPTEPTTAEGAPPSARAPFPGGGGA